MALEDINNTGTDIAMEMARGNIGSVEDENIRNTEYAIEEIPLVIGGGSGITHYSYGG